MEMSAFAFSFGRTGFELSQSGDRDFSYAAATSARSLISLVRASGSAPAHGNASVLRKLRPALLCILPVDYTDWNS